VSSSIGAPTAEDERALTPLFWSHLLRLRRGQTRHEQPTRAKRTAVRLRILKWCSTDPMLGASEWWAETSHLANKFRIYPHTFGHGFVQLPPSQWNHVRTCLRVSGFRRPQRLPYDSEQPRTPTDRGPTGVLTGVFGLGGEIRRIRPDPPIPRRFRANPKGGARR